MSNRIDLKPKIDEVSSSFCLAKWLQVTIDLVHGTTHSCHHPPRHSIPVDELRKNPSALHNTLYKKEQRKKMLEGKRPEECSYCWNIEDLETSHLSDRIIKSTDSWALPHLEEVKQLPWDANISPTYIEVMFGRECNLSCSYCMAQVSSSIVNEIKKYGPYDLKGDGSLHRINSMQGSSYIKEYEVAFWKWLPEVISGLKVLRVTGGEPLLNQNLNRLLDFFEANSCPNLIFAINSNLVHDKKRIGHLISRLKSLIQNQKIQKFELYSSIDSYGPQAEYIRSGLNNDLYFRNLKLFKKELPHQDIIINCTFNILSIPQFRNLLGECISLKSLPGNFILDISYLKDPEYLSPFILTDDLIPYLKSDLAFMRSSNSFTEYEISKFERIYEWIEVKKNSLEVRMARRDFFSFIREYDKRKEASFLKVFPELFNLFKESGSIYFQESTCFETSP